MTAPGREIPPRYPAPCARCGRTARRMIRVRHQHVLTDAATGQVVGTQTETRMEPYCRRCLP